MYAQIIEPSHTEMLKNFINDPEVKALDERRNQRNKTINEFQNKFIKSYEVHIARETNPKIKPLLEKMKAHMEHRDATLRSASYSSPEDILKEHEEYQAESEKIQFEINEAYDRAIEENRKNPLKTQDKENDPVVDDSFIDKIKTRINDFNKKLKDDMERMKSNPKGYSLSEEFKKNQAEHHSIMRDLIEKYRQNNKLGENNSSKSKDHDDHIEQLRKFINNQKLK